MHGARGLQRIWVLKGLPMRVSCIGELVNSCSFQEVEGSWDAAMQGSGPRIGGVMTVDESPEIL